MCKKLSILCFLLVVVALIVPASAAPSVANPLLIDINANDKNANNQPNPSGSPDANCQPGWYNWNFPFDGSAGTSPYSLNMTSTHSTSVTLNTFRADGAKTCGVRNRRAAVAPTTALSKMYSDIFYVAQGGGTGAGLGKNYLAVTFSFQDMEPLSTNNFTFSLFDWDPAFKGSYLSGFGGANEPAGSKKAAWSLTNPATWLGASTYFPKVGAETQNYADSNMPAGLQALLLVPSPGVNNAKKLKKMNGLAPEYYNLLGYGPGDYRYATSFSLNVIANSEGAGAVTIYGWNDMTTWAGSQHMPLCGIRVVPEPATVALLGLGGLALLRRRKRA